MISDEEKIEKFQNSCYKLSEQESTAITEKINNQMDTDINQEIQEYEKEMLEKYEQKIKRLEQKYNTDIFNLNNDFRFKVVEKENEVKEEIRQEVITKIQEFKKTEQYFTFLTKNINNALQKLNPKTGDIVKIYIVKSDLEKYKESLQSSFKYKLEAIDEKYIGGSRCANETQKIAIDNTLDTLIDEKFQNEFKEIK